MSFHSPATPGRRSRVGVVFAKEFREVFRDKRSLIGVVVGPLLITPLLFVVLGLVISSETRKMRSEELRIGVAGVQSVPQIASALRKTPNLRAEPVDASRAEAAIRSRRLRAAVVAPPNASADLARNRSVRLRVLFDEGNQKSTAAAVRLRAALQSAGDALVAARLKHAELPADFAAPLRIVDSPIKSGGARSTLIVASMLPYMLALACFSSGIYAANDSVAGEKERGTLETLLVCPAARRELVLGKFMAVAAVCLVGSILSVVGMSIPFFSGLHVFAWLSRGGVQLSLTGILVTLLMQAPLAVLFAGALLTVSTVARNQREAQTYLGPMMMVIIVPAMMSMITGAEAPKAMAFVPILNASLIIKQALTSSYDPVFLGLALASSILYAALSVAICTRMFERESVLLRT